jgi:hypothetical protein
VYTFRGALKARDAHVAGCGAAPGSAECPPSVQRPKNNNYRCADEISRVAGAVGERQKSGSGAHPVVNVEKGTARVQERERGGGYIDALDPRVQFWLGVRWHL